jgi:hypothetical protein
MADIELDVSTGETIRLADYNAAQALVARVLGAGSGTFGYGQTLSSSQLAAGSVVDDADWDKLRTDLLKARQHISGVDESALYPDINVGQTVTVGAVNDYNIGAQSLEFERFSIAANQQEESATTQGVALTGVAFPGGGGAFIRPWNGTKTGFITFTFASADAARFFFNSGGILRVDGLAGTDGGTPKNQIWFNMTNGVIREVRGVGFYGLTDSYTRLASISAAAGVYVENRYYIDVACNVANNSTGGATTVTFRFIFEDNDVGDQTGTGPAEDENVSLAEINGRSIRSINNVVVDAPTRSAPNF